jgi:hypothetical protein
VVNTHTESAADSHAAVAGVDWEFNSWGGLNGGCYASWAQDNKVCDMLYCLFEKTKIFVLFCSVVLYLDNATFQLSAIFAILPIIWYSYPFPFLSPSIYMEFSTVVFLFFISFHTRLFSLSSGRLHDSLARALPALQIAAGDGGWFVSHGWRGNAVGH